MMGEPITAVQAGLQNLVATLRQDPYALETAYISVITFDSDARQTVPLTELSQFNPPTLAATGTTAKELSKITEIVVRLDTADSNTIKAFFKWVSASISTSSQKVENNKEVHGLSDLPPPPPELNMVI
jgi:uncharacterized protein YegL